MELRHLRYFVAVVEWKGYREASRRLHVAQAAISQTIAALQDELGVALFRRAGRTIALTPEGELFYTETLKTLRQADESVAMVRRASNGEIGSVSIGFCGAATYAFMPDLVRSFKASHPGIKVDLLELSPVAQEEAFSAGRIDIGFNRPVSSGFKQSYESRLLFREPMLVALPECHRLKRDSIRLEELMNESFILFHRKGNPVDFDAITRACHESGFSPRVDVEPNALQTVLALVAADQGISIVPACAQRQRFSGVRFAKLKPNTLRADMLLVLPKQGSSPLARAFAEMTIDNLAEIRMKALTV